MNRLKLTKVIVFDMDDTIFPELDFVKSGYARVDAHLRREYGVTRFFENAWRRFMEGERATVMENALEDSGYASPRGGASDLMEIYREHLPNLKRDAWVDPLFKKLRESGRKIALITDGPPHIQRDKVLALGLDKLCDAVVLSDELGGEAFRKPHAAPYLRVMELVGESDPRACVYIGDNPTKDFRGAAGVGWASIRLRVPGRLCSTMEPAAGYEPDAEVNDGAALQSLLF